MGVLEDFAGWVVHSLLGMQQKEKLAKALNFFIYDTIKVFLLLAAMVFLVAIVRTYVTPQRVRKWLGGRKEGVGNVLAALLGVPTPFCSCSAVPLFIGFVESGVPLGVTFSYLISAPMVNEVAAVMLLGLFGPTIAFLYIASGVTIAIIVGFILGKLKLEHLVEDYVWKIKAGDDNQVIKLTIKKRVVDSLRYTKDLVKKVFPYVLLGVGLGSIIHGYAPENLLTQIAGKNNLFAVPIAVAIGVPLYSNAAGTIPIVKSLIEKGLPLGTSLSFMMAVTALSLPEMIILRKVLKPKLLAIYITILTLGIMFTGFVFNTIL